MFDKTAVEEYRSTTAPAALKQRVLYAANTPKQYHLRIVPLVSALAACLMLIFGISQLDAYDDVMISSDWNLESASSIALPAETSTRIGAAHYADFTLAVKHDIKLETEDSLFVVTEDGELIDTFPYETSHVVNIYWYITSPEAKMTVNGVPYTLIADEHNGTFQIVQD